MKEIINKLKSKDNFRTLCDTETLQKYIINSNKQYLNLSSNDYLGLGASTLQSQFFDNLNVNNTFILGNPSSRLMTGNSFYYNLLEKRVSELYNKENSLVLSSGFMLNSGALPALTTSNDYIIADKLVHASLIDGIKMCSCEFARFKHNDTKHLRSILSKTACKGTIYVVLESIYSMDGDQAPLEEILELKKEFNFKIYLDEAHAFGVLGDRGLGLAEQKNLIEDIDYIIVTMGKATASQGAFIVSDNISKEMLVNKMRTLIFSTALPPISLMWSLFVIEQITSMKEKRDHLKEISRKLSDAVTEITGVKTANSHIIPIIIGGNKECVEMANKLKDCGYWVTAIRYPTVAKDKARLRISLTAEFTMSDIDDFIISLKTIFRNFQKI